MWNANVMRNEWLQRTGWHCPDFSLGPLLQYGAAAMTPAVLIILAIIMTDVAEQDNKYHKTHEKMHTERTQFHSFPDFLVAL